jgi:ABC-type phosphate transport system substrate-binding protein
MRLILLALIAHALPAADLVLVANPDHAGAKLSRQEVAEIYCGRMTHWADGARVVPAYLTDGPVHEAFLRNYVGKSDFQFIATWKKLVFSGKSSMPDSVASEAEMVARIRTIPGALGYVSSGTSTEGVVVVAVE